MVCEECEDCSIIPSSVVISNCSLPCNCTVDVICGSEILTLTGTVEDEYVSGTDNNSPCNTICHDGEYCQRNLYCKVGGFDRVFGKAVLETTILRKELDDCDPDCTTGQCCVAYQCPPDENQDINLIELWCEDLAGPGSNECPSMDFLTPPFPCAEDPISSCPELFIAPPVVMAIGHGNDGTSYTTIQYEILQGDRFEVSKVYPNPFRDQLNIIVRANYSGFVKINIYDSFGRLVKNDELSILNGENNLSIDFGKELSDGMYYLHVIDGKMSEYSTKIIHKSN